MKKIILFYCIFLLCAKLSAQEYQWSIKTPVLKEGDRQGKGYMWIPPGCKKIRAVVLAQDVVMGGTIFNSPIFRQYISDLDFALVWTNGKYDPTFSYRNNPSKMIDRLLAMFGEESGYKEINSVPIVPIGYSFHASYPWNFAADNPERTLAILSIHGDVPLSNKTGSGRRNPDWSNRNIDGIPSLTVMGEYELTDERIIPAVNFQKKHPDATWTLLSETGMSHHAFTNDMISFLGLFLRKAAYYRLNTDSGRNEKLRYIKKKDGWLIEMPFEKKAPLYAAPFAMYKGDITKAFWCFDKEMVEGLKNFVDNRKKKQLIGYFQDGKVVAEQPQTMQQSVLKFTPLGDGLTFSVSPVFQKKVPAGNPEWWSGLPAGSTVGHANGGGPIEFVPFSLEIKEIGANLLKVDFSRYFPATYDDRKTNLFFLFSHKGDKEFRAAVGPGGFVDFPLSLKSGIKQNITFPPIPDMVTNATGYKLNAFSDAKLPVYYYVECGPAVITGNEIKFTSIPPMTKYPIKVTVVAWQYGQLAEPKIQTAEPVEMTFYLNEGKN